MKKVLTRTSIIIVLVFAVATSGYAAVKILGAANRGLVFDWKMDEGIGTTLADNSGNGNGGTLNGGTPPSWIDPGRFGKAVSFNGTDQYAISDAPVASLGTIDQPYTISTWVKIAPGETEGNIIHISNNSNGIGWCIPFMRLTDGKFTATSYNSGAVNAQQSDTPTTDTWHHVAETWSSTNGLRLYVDGTLKATTPQSNFTSANQPLYIQPARGAGGCDSNTGFFNGRIDDTRIYSKELSQPQISALYSSNTDSIATVRAIGTIAHLVDWWTFDRYDLQGETLINKVSNNDGSPGYPPTIVKGKIKQALSFTGAQYVNITRSVADDFSICAWINTTDVGGGTNHWQSMPIYDSENGGTSNDFSLGVDSNGKLMFGDGNGAFDYSASTSQSVNTGVWTHVCVTREKSSGNFRLYVNGVFDTVHTGSTTSLNSNSSAMIGQGFDGAVPWNGLIDDVRVYDSVLSGKEVASIYNASETIVNDSRNTRITEGLAGLWSFDGPDVIWASAVSGEAYDRSGQENTGTLNNMTQSVSVVPGRIGQALHFDGDNQYISVPGDFPTGLEARTMCAWIKSDDTTYEGNADHVIGYGNAANSEAFGIMIFEGNNWYFYGHGDSDYNTGISVDTKWHHHCVTYNGSTLTYYYDGASVGNAYRSLNTASGGMTFGTRPDLSANNEFNGSIDDVRIYNNILTSDKIKQLYLMGK